MPTAATPAAKKAASARTPEGLSKPINSDDTGDLDQTQVDALWAALTAPFPADHIEKLPKPTKRNDDDKGTCREGSRYSADGHYCGKYHARSVHLDYVGHAGVTTRLNDVLGPAGWDFQPMLTAEGADPIGRSTFYGALTIMGVTKWDLAANYNGPQEALGDCLRRCAMRFGVGTYLWSKSEAAAALAVHTEPDDSPADQVADRQAPETPPAEAEGLAPHQQRVANTIANLSAAETTTMVNWAREGGVPAVAALTERQAANFMEYLEWLVGQRPPA